MNKDKQPPPHRNLDHPTCSLWNNDLVRNASKAMSKQDKEKYAKIGESMYKDVDFTTSQINVAPFMKEAIYAIEESLKAGLHPSMMTKEEKELMKDVYGAEWYIQHGYKKEDLDDFVTFGYNPLSKEN